MCIQQFKGKKLLILAGAEVHCKVVRAAKELGAYTIVTDYLTIENSPAKQIADEYWMLNITDVDAIVEKCKEVHINGVIAYCIDPAQIPYQQICERLSLPCYGNKEQFAILTNKKLFKDFCRSHNVDVIQEYSIADVQSDNVIYPVLIKPVESRGSRGQSICHSKDEVQDAIEFARNESGNGEILIERYMKDGCQDMCLSYTVINGIPYLYRIGDRYLGTVEDGLQRQAVCSIHPSTYVNEYMEVVHPIVCDFIKALGIRFGGVFLQGIWENGKIYMYDPGLRFPGSDFDEAILKAVGFDNMKSSIAFALTGDITTQIGNPQGAFLLNGGVGFVLSVSARPGKIMEFRGIEELAQHPYVLKVSKRHKIGDIITRTGDIKQRVVEFIVYMPEGENATDFIEYIYDKLEILDENGNNMVTSKVIFPETSRYFSVKHSRNRQ